MPRSLLSPIVFALLLLAPLVGASGPRDVVDAAVDEAQRTADHFADRAEEDADAADAEARGYVRDSRGACFGGPLDAFEAREASTRENASAASNGSADAVRAAGAFLRDEGPFPAPEQPDLLALKERADAALLENGLFAFAMLGALDGLACELGRPYGDLANGTIHEEVPAALGLAEEAARLATGRDVPLAAPYAAAVADAEQALYDHGVEPYPLPPDVVGIAWGLACPLVSEEC